MLRRLFGGVSLTRAVYDEVLAGGNKPGGAQSRIAVESGWMQVIAEPAAGPAFAHLGPGEASTLRAALAAKSGALVILDDSLARAAAARRGLVHIAGLGVVAAAKQRGLIRAARPYFERLANSGFYVSTALLKALLRDLDESA